MTTETQPPASGEPEGVPTPASDPTIDVNALNRAWLTGPAPAALAEIEVAEEIEPPAPATARADVDGFEDHVRMYLREIGTVHLLTWDGEKCRASIQGAENKATLVAQLIAPGVTWRGAVTDEFPVPVDAKYTKGEITGSYITGKWSNQSHLTLESADSATDFTVFAVLWPDRSPRDNLAVVLRKDSSLEITRPDGKRDFVRIDDNQCKITRATSATIGGGD